MASRIYAIFTSGVTLYAIVRNQDGQVWNGTAFENYNAANWSTYAVTMTEQGATGYYAVATPALGVGVFHYEVHQRAGGSPAVSDATVWVEDLDPSSNVIAGSLGASRALFVDGTSGNNANTGTTPATAKQTLASITPANGDAITVLRGDQSAVSMSVTNASVAVRAAGSSINNTGAANPTFSVGTGGTLTLDVKSVSSTLEGRPAIALDHASATANVKATTVTATGVDAPAISVSLAAVTRFDVDVVTAVGYDAVILGFGVHIGRFGRLASTANDADSNGLEISGNSLVDLTLGSVSAAGGTSCIVTDGFTGVAILRGGQFDQTVRVEAGTVYFVSCRLNNLTVTGGTVYVDANTIVAGTLTGSVTRATSSAPTVDQIVSATWSNATRTLTGFPPSLQSTVPQQGVGAFIPGSRVEDRSIARRIVSRAGTSVVLLARVVGADGDYITQADIASAATLITNQLDSTTSTSTETVSAIVYNTLQADGRWTEDALGYNVAVIISGSRLSVADCSYLARVTLTDTNSRPIVLEWEIQTR